jgi:hypothetical protein
VALLHERLLAVGRHLVDDQGLLPSEAECRVFIGLTALTPHALVFRAGVGLAEPLPRGEASDLATAVGRALRGAPDRDFQRQLLLAHLRGLLMQNAHDSAEELRRGKSDITPENLRSALMFAVVYARPRSELWPSGVSDAEVEEMINVVVNDYFGGAHE